MWLLCNVFCASPARRRSPSTRRENAISFRKVAVSYIVTCSVSAPRFMPAGRYTFVADASERVELCPITSLNEDNGSKRCQTRAQFLDFALFSVSACGRAWSKPDNPPTRTLNRSYKPLHNSKRPLPQEEGTLQSPLRNGLTLF